MGRPLDEDAINHLIEDASERLEALEEANMSRNQQFVELKQGVEEQMNQLQGQIDTLDGHRDAINRMEEKGLISTQQKDEQMREIDEKVKEVHLENTKLNDQYKEKVQEISDEFNKDAEKIRKVRGEIERYKEMLDAINSTSPPSSEQKVANP